MCVCVITFTFNFAADILEIDPAPNNGTAGRLHHILNHPKQLPPIPAPKSSAGDCPYPMPNADYEDRINSDMSGCSCLLEVSYRARLT